MWQICGSIPQSLLHKTDVTCIAAQLSVSFFIETFIHAKEKVIVLLTLIRLPWTNDPSPRAVFIILATEQAQMERSSSRIK